MADFESTYRTIFGERWPALRAALLEPTRHVAWVNPYAPHPPAEATPVAGLAHCWVREGGFPPPEPNGLLPYYLLDAASVWAARALEVRPGDRVLDLCAAPGGKSLVLAESLAEQGELVANERSSQRRQRLQNVLKNYLPPRVLVRVRVSGHDASRWGLYEQNAYDRVLLDAPCSGERHVLHRPRELAKWAPNRSKQLARQQFAMLCAALEAVRVGGRMVYSTCALSPLENDGVIEKLLKRREGRVRAVPLSLPVGEATRFGWRILPDTTGWGPIYLACLEKLA